MILGLLPLRRSEVQQLTRTRRMELGPGLLLLPLQCNSGKKCFSTLGFIYPLAIQSLVNDENTADLDIQGDLIIRQL